MAVKQLAGQTLWYGLSNVGARFLNYLLTPLLTWLLNDHAGQVQFGEISLMYAWFGVLNVVFTYGMETAYFRFCAQNKEERPSIFQTAFGSLLLSTIFFCALIFLFRFEIDRALEFNGHPEYIVIALLILGFDTLQAIPFAKLRQENKPRKYAFIKILGILINIMATIFFLVWMPKLAAANPNGLWVAMDARFNRVSLVLLANLLQSLFVFFILFNEWKTFRFQIDRKLWFKLWAYGSPMIIIGMAGMVNEVLDRVFLLKWYNGTLDQAKTAVGIYSANYKLSIIITLFINAFKMAAEPFFFSRAADKNAPQLYARVMNWFVITLSLAFLVTALFLDDWILILGDKYRSGITVVPILLMANVFSGIYYNLSIWYKLSDKMRYGMYLTVLGALITVVGNYLFIPQFGIMAAAWTTCICYAVMALLCYVYGQKYYPIPYDTKRILGYLSLILVLFFVQYFLGNLLAEWSANHRLWLLTASGFLLLLGFMALVIKWERKELVSLPVVGKFLKK